MPPWLTETVMDIDPVVQISWDGHCTVYDSVRTSTSKPYATAVEFWSPHTRTIYSFHSSVPPGTGSSKSIRAAAKLTAALSERHELCANNFPTNCGLHPSIDS
jgi:hypothetical protein